MELLPFLTFGAGLLLGLALTFLWSRGRQVGQAQLLDTFKALAADTLGANSASFLQLAEGKLAQKQQAVDALITPMQKTLEKMDTELRALEVKREGAYRELLEGLAASRQTQIQLQKETGQLLQALRTPSARGRWGEIQLQRLLEMTGMSEHAHDFSTQVRIDGDEGGIRPDVIVALPGNRSVVIDSKVPLSAYLDSVQTADDAVRAAALKDHARLLRDHVKKLAAKSYGEKITEAPAFVVLFLPGEHFLSAALDADADLLDYSIMQKVVLATPMTMVALLRAVAYGWRQDALHRNTQEIGALGHRLHVSLSQFASQLGQLGSRIGQAVEAYNKAIGIFDRKLLPEAEKLGTYGAVAAEDQITAPDEVARLPRQSKNIPDEDEEKTGNAA